MAPRLLTMRYSVVRQLDADAWAPVIREIADNAAFPSAPGNVQAVFLILQLKYHKEIIISHPKIPPIFLLGTIITRGILGDVA
jgi:hypothetical protein